MPAPDLKRAHLTHRTGLPVLALVLLSAVLSMGARRCEREHCRRGDDRRECAPRGCEQDGKHFDAGESFPSADGCNTCSCTENGQIFCTLRACVAPDGGVADGCDYNGDHYEVGDDFPSDDGCNTCFCGEGGSVGCTKRACLPDACGGLLGAGCPTGQYCSYPVDALCGAADATGRCAAIPEGCADIYLPVCGCDDKTYGNACEAAVAGVSVASEGECSDAGTGGGTCTMGDTTFEDGASLTCSDGCNSCTCDAANGGWISTLILCAPLPKAELCEGGPSSSAGLGVEKLYRDRDALAVSLTYGGGCFPHTFKLCYSDAFAESSPVQARIWVEDTTEMVDTCLALPTVQEVFDLSPLRQSYMAQYPDGPNTIVLNLDKNNVTYEF